MYGVQETESFHEIVSNGITFKASLRMLLLSITLVHSSINLSIKVFLHAQHL